jgi:hypothetical protein
MEYVYRELRATVNTAAGALRRIGDEESRTPILPGGWSRKHVIGHLIDSASNNHQRFVRAVLQGELDFPGYDQDGMVKVQAVQDCDWLILVNLWESYNDYLAHVIRYVPAEALKTKCRVGSHDPVSLEFLIGDYIRHLKHHLRQIRALPED